MLHKLLCEGKYHKLQKDMLQKKLHMIPEKKNLNFIPDLFH